MIKEEESKKDRKKHTVIAEIFVRLKVSYSSIHELSYAIHFCTARAVSHALVYVHGFRMLLNFVLSAKGTKYTKLIRVRKFLWFRWKKLRREAWEYKGTEYRVHMPIYCTWQQLLCLPRATRLRTEKCTGVDTTDRMIRSVFSIPTMIMMNGNISLKTRKRQNKTEKIQALLCTCT